MKKTERRGHKAGIELRSAGEGVPVGTIAGYAAVFNAASDDLGGFVEIIAPGAFDGCLESDIRALWNHDDGAVLGRTKSGTLRLALDARGLSCEIDLPDTDEGRAAATLVGRGDVDGMSFGFYTEEDSWAFVDGKVVRTLIKVNLFEVSLATFPAYTDTEAALRGLSQFRSGGKPAADAARIRMDMALRLSAAR